MSKPMIKNAMVPIDKNCSYSAAISLARILADEVNLVGIIPIEGGGSVSAEAQTARQLRKIIKGLNGGSYKFKLRLLCQKALGQI